MALNGDKWALLDANDVAFAANHIAGHNVESFALSLIPPGQCVDHKTVCGSVSLWFDRHAVLNPKNLLVRECSR